MQTASLTFSAILLVSLVMGIVLNFTMFWCTIVNSALTTTIVGVLKGVGSTVSSSISNQITETPCFRSSKTLTSYTVSLRRLFQTLGFVLLGGVEVHTLNVTGLVINTFGGVWYSYAKYMQKRKMPKRIAPDVEAHPHK
jgi:solute carrier family 35 protein